MYCCTPLQRGNILLIKHPDLALIPNTRSTDKNEVISHTASSLIDVIAQAHLALGLFMSPGAYGKMRGGHGASAAVGGGDPALHRHRFFVYNSSCSKVMGPL